MIETVKKLNWSPDIIHVHGWLAYMLPLYLRHYYGNEPLFKDAKIVTSIYNENFDGTLNEEMRDKILFDGMEKRDLKHLKEPSFVNLAKTAADNSDAVIVGSDDLPENLLDYLKKINKPLLPYKTREEFSQAYQDFYTTKILAE